MTSYIPSSTGAQCDLFYSVDWERLPEYDGDDCKANCVVGCVMKGGEAGESNFRALLYGLGE